MQKYFVVHNKLILKTPEHKSDIIFFFNSFLGEKSRNFISHFLSYKYDSNEFSF